MKNKTYKHASAVIIKNKVWDILFLKRKSNWLWTIPWWKLEEWENSIKCAKRELKEETWIENIELDFFSHTISYTNWIYWKETTYIWEVDNISKIKNIETDIFTEIRFMNINKLPKLSEIEEYDHIIVDMLKWIKERYFSFDEIEMQ